MNIYIGNEHEQQLLNEIHRYKVRFRIELLNGINERILTQVKDKISQFEEMLKQYRWKMMLATQMN